MHRIFKQKFVGISALWREGSSKPAIRAYAAITDIR